MVDTAGNKLRRARQARHLSLEDAARATKIRVHQLADLEADDYSNFANLAYARSFLANYSKFLQVDLRAYLEGFAGSDSFGLEDYQYLSDKPVGVYRIPYRRSSQARRPQRRQLVGTAVGLAACALLFFGWLLVVNVQRLGPLDKLAARQEAREKAAHEGPAAPASVDTAAVAVKAAPAPNPEASVAPIPVGEPTDLPALAPGGGVIPVSVPAASTPAPTAAPAAAPVQVTIPALATVDEPGSARPALPLSGERGVARELLTAHSNPPQPQKVANDHPRR